MPERIARAWEEASWALGIRAAPGVASDLVRRWSEPHRRYHDRTHLEACLALFDEVRGEAERTGEVVAALLFHDAVYDPRRTDNEARSAALAAEALAGAPPDALRRVQAAILATQVHVAATSDEALVLDVDLSILGASDETYDRFEASIRDEYAHVPDAAYRAGRTAILRSFDVRTPIFRTPALRERFEARAHENLARALASLHS